MNLLDTVQIVRAPVVAGAYGSQAPNWAGASTVTYAANMQPYSRRSAVGLEAVVNEERVGYRMRAFLPSHADVVSTDRLVWRGHTYEIGGIELWARGVGPVHHYELELTRVEGG